MEHNSLAMESLILCYIESKNLLRTKQLDQGGFNKLLIKSCEGLNYSDEEILSTWRNLVSQYLQVKNNSLEKESWKYYKIMDSCYEVSDFHQIGQSKFSEEMVWFLIECLLKRRNIRKRSHNLERMIEVYHKFLEEGYEILLLQDIQTKWRYLNYRYSKLEGTKDAPLKMQYFAAIDGFRTGQKCVKINFTKSLTEILIRKFTEKKVMCNFHGYDSPQLLNEIQSEFQNLESNLGFDFSCKELKDKWDKLAYVYEFLQKKHKTESQWMYFQAMREHFEGKILNGFKPLNTTVNVLKNEYKSPDKNEKSKLTVVDQFDERSMTPLKTEKEENFESFDSIASIKTQKVENKKNKKKNDENTRVKPLNTSENVLKKKSKSVGEANKNKKLKMTVIDQFNERSISPLHTEKGEKSFDSIASIRTQKVESKKNDENISNVSEKPPKSNDTSKKKQKFKIKEPKHNYNGDISCAPNDHLKVAKPRTKKIRKSSNESISSSSLKNQEMGEYTKTKKNLRVDRMKDNCTSNFLTVSLEKHSPYVNDLADNIQDVEQINSAELLTSEKSEVHINNNDSNMDENSFNTTVNLSSITKNCSDNEFLPHPDVDIEYLEEVNSSESVTSQKSEDYINNESNIDMDSCNVTINLPSITKKFSGNEFLPLKKRLRLNKDEVSLTKGIKNGFRGFSVMDQIHAQSCAQAKDFIQLIGGESPAEVMTDMPVREDMTDMPVTEDMTDMPETEDLTDMPGTEDTNNIDYTLEENYEPEENLVSHSFQSPNNVSPPSVISPKRDHHPLAEQDFHTNGVLPQPVLLFVDKVDEINSSVECGTFCELYNGLSLEKDEEIKGEGNSDEVEDRNDPHRVAGYKYEDTSLKETVSTELIETSIADESISEMDIRSSEYYQKPEMTIQHKSPECVESEVSRENCIFVEENTNLTTENMEFSNETLDTSSEYATVDTNFEGPNNNMEYHTKLLESTINHLETQQCQTDYVEQTKCNSEYSSLDIPEGNGEENFQHNHKSILSPTKSNLNHTDAMDTEENVKTEMKSVRLPVTCGGKLKEIFISPRELNKIVKMKPNSVKHLKNLPMMTNGEKCISKSNCKNIKFMSQVIKEANVTINKNCNLTNDKSNETLNNSNIIPPKVSSSTVVLDRNQQSPICPDGEFDVISIVSSMMDDEQLSDDLLADVIEDFQAQSTQELKDIKNLVRENNVLQRETNRILRQILEKL